MRKLICDKCGKLIKENEPVFVRSLCYHYDVAIPANWCKDYDLCSECSEKLDNLLYKTQANFINKRRA